MLLGLRSSCGSRSRPALPEASGSFTADEALWEFENLFVLSGETGSLWRESRRYLKIC